MSILLFALKVVFVPASLCTTVHVFCSVILPYINDAVNNMALLLGSSIEGGAGPGAGVDEYVMEEVLKWWQRRKELVYGGNPC